MYILLFDQLDGIRSISSQNGRFAQGWAQFNGRMRDGANFCSTDARPVTAMMDRDPLPGSRKTTTAPAGRGIYLVGSVPLSSTAEVIETISAAFGSRISRIPDGEVGERSDWVSHLERLFRDHPDFERSDEVFGVHAGAAQRYRYRLKAGKAPRDVEFGNLGYADNARASYAEFVTLRNAGKISSGTRFQVDLVPAHSVLWLFVVEQQQSALDAVYNAAVVREIAAITAAIPHDDLAIQLDIASAVFARLERGEPSVYGRTKEEMRERFGSIVADLADRVPADVDLMFHFCYGDANHRHAVEPSDMGDMVEMANRIKGKIARSIQLIHMPVPRERSDAAYFAPLHRLALGPDTELALGLVHYTDGIEGTKRRMDTARQFVSRYAVATECGFGRRAPETIPALLRLHLAAADYV
jgi:hypothetical protein